MKRLLALSLLLFPSSPHAAPPTEYPAVLKGEVMPNGCEVVLSLSDRQDVLWVLRVYDSSPAAAAGMKPGDEVRQGVPIPAARAEAVAFEGPEALGLFLNDMKGKPYVLIGRRGGEVWRWAFPPPAGKAVRSPVGREYRGGPAVRKPEPCPVCVPPRPVRSPLLRATFVDTGRGAEVVKVDEGGPADCTGLKPGDVVTGYRFREATVKPSAWMAVKARHLQGFAVTPILTINSYMEVNVIRKGGDTRVALPVQFGR